VVRRYSDPDPYFGQAVTALLQGLEGLPGCEIHIVCATQKPLRSPEKVAENIFYHSVVVPKWGWMRGGYIGCVRTIWKKLREIKPDVVHGQGTERDCALSAVFSGFPNVLTIHGNMRLIAKINRARPFSFAWLAARLERLTLPRTNGVICISTYTRQNVAGLVSATWLVPNAADKAFFDVSRNPAPQKCLLCLGHITPRKNQIKLINALEPLSANQQFEVLFHGGAVSGDPYVNAFLKLVKERSWCRFGGTLDSSGVRAALAEATMLVLPSLEDNCPMVVLEAMAAGVPVAASKVGGIPDLITDGVDGVLFDPSDIDSIRAAVASVVSNSAEAERMARAAKVKALHYFHPQVIARRHLEIYREVLDNIS
jgi:glycosyltransferase involved in cell wall biosynthesis